MRKRTSIISIILILVALLIFGFTYIQWNDTTPIASTLESNHLTLRFTEPLTFWDNEDIRDVGNISCYYNDLDPDVEGYESLTIAINNAYPGFEGYCNFTIKNVGTITEHVINFTITLGSSLIVGSNYSDANNNLIGWQLNDSTTKEPAIYIYICNSTGMSLICNELEPEESNTGKIIIQIADGVQEYQTYSFKIEINCEQVTPP